MNSIASTQKRLGAFVIDDIIVSLFVFMIFYEQITTLATPEAIMFFLQENFITITLLKIIYHTFLVWHNGMTLGKYFLKIKTIDEQSGETPDFIRSLLRAVVRIFSEFILYIGFLLAFFNPKVQTIHDKISGVVVVDA